MSAAQGTADLTHNLIRLMDAHKEGAARKRAMMLSFVDEWERLLGYGEDGNQPRTAQIRQYWRDMGEPEL